MIKTSLDMSSVFLFALISYLLGSLPFAVITSHLMGLADPRTYGSGNPGATNVLRTGNKKAAILTLLGDAAKGWLAVWLAMHFNGAALIIAISAVCVFLGHLFPLFLRFKGGKGVATAAGILLALSPMLGGATILTWIIVAVFFRMSSLAAIAAALFAPFYFILLSGVHWPGDSSRLIAISVISFLLIYRHRTNIGRIISGTEPRLGKSANK